MFDSLDDQIKHDLDRESTPRERWVRYGVIAVASIILFGGLIWGVQVFS
jgi:hypothetical protein